jgi:hypothetical protein
MEKVKFYQLIDRLQKHSEWKYPNRKWNNEFYYNCAFQWLGKDKEVIENIVENAYQSYVKQYNDEDYKGFQIEYIPLNELYYCKINEDYYIYDSIRGYKYPFGNLYGYDIKLRDLAKASKTKYEALKVIDSYITYQKLTKPEIINV